MQGALRLVGYASTLVGDALRLIEGDLELIQDASASHKRTNNDRDEDLSVPSFKDLSEVEESDDVDGERCRGRCPLRRLVHYRYVVKEVGKPLSAATSGRKLLACVIDCVNGTSDQTPHGMLAR